MKRPSLDDMQLAADWLSFNEGEGEELAACKAVEAWLRETVEASVLRTAARKAGVPVSRLRARLRLNQNPKEGGS